MSFIFSTASAVRVDTRAAAPSQFSFWGKPALLIIVALSVVEAGLFFLGAAELRMTVLLCLGIPAAIAFRATKVAASARACKVAPFELQSWSANGNALMEVGDDLIERCQREKQPLSVVIFDQTDLPELQSIFGRDVAEQMVSQLARKLHAMAPGKGLSIRTDENVFTVLMPGFDRKGSLAAVRQALGSTCSVEFTSGEDEIVLVPDFVIHTVRSGAGSMKEIYRALRRDMKQQQKNESRRQLYLRRERESHSSRSVAPQP